MMESQTGIQVRSFEKPAWGCTDGNDDGGRKDLDERRSHGTSRCSHAKAKSLGHDALTSATAFTVEKYDILQ